MKQVSFEREESVKGTPEIGRIAAAGFFSPLYAFPAGVLATTEDAHTHMHYIAGKNTEKERKEKKR